MDVPGRLRGEVELRDVGFSYAGADRPALDGVSLRVAPGETVALVGATGAGKSTLVKLLARFYDADSGAVLVDGVDVRRLPAGRLPPPARGGPAGGAPVHRRRRVEHRLRAPGRHAARDRGGGARGRGARPGAAGCPQGSARPSVSAGRGCRRGSASSSRWPAPSSSPRTCCCSTRPPPRSTRRPRPPSSAAGDRVTSRGGAPRSSSRTGWRRRRARTGSSCCTAAGSPSRVRPRSCSRGAGGSPGCGGPASWSPPQTRRAVTTMISME